MEEPKNQNPLGSENIGKLIRTFAIPSIIAMIVTSLYNMVDQFFIGHTVGELGNAATNVAFPLTPICLAVALCCGIGGASAFNLKMGEGKSDEAKGFLGNAITCLVVIGIIITTVTEVFLTKLLRLFGSPDSVLPYAKTYVRITALGFPFHILTFGGGHLIRADGRPKRAMLANISGAVLNTILDALFCFVFKWGIAGAAWATVIGQIVSGLIALISFTHCKTVKLKFADLLPRGEKIKRIFSLGVAPGTNQIANTVVQIALNNSLSHYGSLSAYGASVPLACSGITSKVSMVFYACSVGFAQGLQPIASFNHGAGNHARVKEAYIKTCKRACVISVIAFLLFQIFPKQIILLFGDGSDEYVAFATKLFRIYLFFTFANFLQPITSNFFTALGKPKMGTFLSLTRQIIFFLPLIIILPLIFGIDGIVYSAPVADCVAAILCAVLAYREFRLPEYKNHL